MGVPGIPETLSQGYDDHRAFRAPARNELRRGLLLRPNDHSRNIAGVDRGVIKVGACELGEVDQLVADFLDFTADLLAGFHPQLDDLADILLEDPEDGIARLKIDFTLAEEIRGSERKQDGDEK
jgi:hypothetical protein